MLLMLLTNHSYVPGVPWELSKWALMSTALAFGEGADGVITYTTLCTSK